MGQQPLFSKVIKKKGSLLVSNVLGQKEPTIRRFVEVWLFKSQEYLNEAANEKTKDLLTVTRHEVNP